VAGIVISLYLSDHPWCCNVIVNGRSLR
jgi:hypothetical protein